MIAVIKCTTCDEEIGLIQKDCISDTDIEMYQGSTSCSQEHFNSQVIVNDPEEGFVAPLVSNSQIINPSVDVSLWERVQEFFS